MLIVLYIAGVIAGLVLGCIILAWILYVPIAVRIFGDSPLLLSATFEKLVGGERCELATDDGAVLRGTYLHTLSPERVGVIAFCHELTGDRTGAVRYVDRLRNDGFDVFTFDFRNHGSSQPLPGYRPMPWLTQHDLADARAVVEYLSARADADPRGIGILGVSKGGTAALCVAAGHPRVRAIVTDGAFATESMQVHYIRRFMEIYTSIPGILSRSPDMLLMLLARWTRLLIGLRHGCRFVNVEASAGRVTQPVLMIHGERDQHIPLAVAHTLRQHLGGLSKLWIVPGAKHNGAVHVAPDEYHRRVSRFFSKHLGEPRFSRRRRTPVRRFRFRLAASRA